MAEIVEWLHTYNNTIILVEQIFATLLFSCFAASLLGNI